MDLLSVIAPIFIIILIGFLCAKAKLLSVTTFAEMGRYVMYVALPAVIVKTLLTLDLAALFNPNYFISYICASLVTLGLGIVVFIALLKQPWPTTSVSVTGMVVPNSAFIGFPLLSQILADPPLSGFAMALIVENLIVVPICFVLMDYHHSSSSSSLATKVWLVLKRSIKNPLLIAIVLGIVGNLAQITLPQVAQTTLDLLAPSAVAVALFVIGGSLATVVLSETHWRAVTLTLMGKLVLHPLIAMAIGYALLRDHPELFLTLVLITCVPMLSTFTVIGERYRQSAFCASTQLLTTLCSLLTIPLMVFLAHLLVKF
ncbi:MULTISPECIES: AEC family transporter [unclassified Vibrio]|uniref:AEC family transporter n=1 Tax=Vibrio sp. HB236076 TaxID=3232307 RepID=A0AB39HJL6_9VIBR|nr:AEC family transporter [Vibrio sp. HB161653]MDP5253056.1 AEC family transporter [Vibrio sp. HB161653]